MSASHPFLASIDLDDISTWPDARIGGLLLACKFITSAEAHGQEVSQQLLDMVASSLPHGKQIERIDPKHLPTAQRSAVELITERLAGGEQLSEAGAAFRSAIGHALDQRDAQARRLQNKKLAEKTRKYNKARVSTAQSAHEEWNRAANKPDLASLSKRERARRIGKRFQVSFETVRKVIA